MKNKSKKLVLIYCFSLFFFALGGELEAEEDCVVEFYGNYVLNMKEKWFGGCKMKCGYVCEMEGLPETETIIL